MFGIRKHRHITHKLVDAGWLSMSNRRLLHSACLYHKIIINKTPSYLYRKILFRTDVHNVNIRFKGKLTPPVHRTETFKRSFSYQITKVYNGLPNIKQYSFFKFKNFKKKSVC